MQKIKVTALKSDGSIHRQCESELELQTHEGCVVWTPCGAAISDAQGFLYTQDAHVRAYLVYGARLNLLEVFELDLSLREIYINVTAPMERFDSEIIYIDKELDVTKAPSKEATVVDEDEFSEAIKLYDYSEDLVEKCWAAALLGQKIANSWEVSRDLDKALSTLALTLR